MHVRSQALCLLGLPVVLDPLQGLHESGGVLLLGVLSNLLHRNHLLHVGLRQREEIGDILEGHHACLDEESRQGVSLIGLHVVLGPLQLRLLRVAPDGERPAVHLHAALVDLLREHAIRWVHEDHSAILLEAVDLVVLDLHLAQLLAQRNALLLLPEIAKVLTLVHDGKASSGHLELVLVLGRPGDGMSLASGPGHVAAG
mmetsp:Transcript_21506/g.51174  ORF Transcript_21506/g.51174 Transcript_21506/m.51174 type:complete len:200 (+) Transcript_21506:93-692(+)